MKKLFILLVFMMSSNLLISQETFNTGFEESSFLRIESSKKIVFPDSVFIGTGTASTILEDGSILYVDNTIHKAFYFNKNGDFVRSFGREGRGPGDFLDINDLFVDDNEVYFFDSKNSRIQIFDLLSGNFDRTINLDKAQYSNSELIRFDEKIRIFGSLADNNMFIHDFSLEGEYLTSFGEFIDFGSFLNNNNARIQLRVLHEAIDKDQIIYTIGAPYRIFSYTFDGKPLWEIEDEILPKPWIDHIIIRPDSYQAKFYPTTHLSTIVDRFLVVFWLNPDSKKSYVDFRDKNNGELIRREEFKYDIVPIAVREINHSKNNFIMLSKSRSKEGLMKYEIEISDQTQN